MSKKKTNPLDAEVEQAEAEEAAAVKAMEAAFKAMEDARGARWKAHDKVKAANAKRDAMAPLGKRAADLMSRMESDSRGGLCLHSYSSKPTMDQQTSIELIRLGFVEFVRHGQDSRDNLHSLTDAGRAKLAEHRAREDAKNA